MKTYKIRFFLLLVLFFALPLLGSCSDSSSQKSNSEKKNNPPDSETISDKGDQKDSKNSSDTNFRQIRIVSFNCEWLFDNDPSDQPDSPPKIQRIWPKTRDAYEKKLRAVADELISLDAHIYALQEIEDKEVLDDLARLIEKKLKKKYISCYVKGQDTFTGQNVGFLSSLPVLEVRRFQYLKPVKVTKHLMVKIQVGEETITLVNLHLKAGKRGRRNWEKRRRQATSIHNKLAPAIKRGENVIVLGDINTQVDYKHDHDYDGGAADILSGRHTLTRSDNLQDLHHYLAARDRGTHSRYNSPLDRIIVSFSLIEDDPRRKDLVFSSITRIKTNRQASDHYALQADFIIR